MTYQELKYGMSFVTTLSVSIAYAVIVRGMQSGGSFDGPDGTATIGKALLLFIAAIVVVNILTQILLAIGATITGNEIEMNEDERDTRIEQRAMTFAFSVFSVGFLLSLVALALGQAPFVVFHGIIASMVACGLAADLFRLWLHRRGF